MFIKNEKITSLTSKREMIESKRSKTMITCTVLTFGVNVMLIPFSDTAAILDSIVLAETLWDAQGANDPKTVVWSDWSRVNILFFYVCTLAIVLYDFRVCPPEDQAGVTHAISPISIKLSLMKGYK